MMPGVMNSNNSSDSFVEENCLFSGQFAWRQRYLTKEVHANLALTIALNVVASPMTVMLNALVIYTTFTNPLLRDAKSNIVVALMSVTDLAAGAIAQPLFIASAGCRISGRCNSCIVDSAMLVTLFQFCCASVFHIALVAADRLIAIKCPFRYINLVTSTRIAFGVILAWSLATLIALSPSFGIDEEIFVYVDNGCILVLVGGVTIFVIVCYVIMYLESRRHQNAIQVNIPQYINERRKKEFQAAKTTFLVTCSIGFTYIVNGVAIAVIRTMLPIDDSISNATVYFSVECWSVTLFLLNSLLNPLIYTWRMEKIAAAMREVLGQNTVEPAPQEIEMNVLLSRRAWVIPLERELSLPSSPKQARDDVEAV